MLFRSGKKGVVVTSMSMESVESMDGAVKGWAVISMGIVWFWYYSLISHILYLISHVSASDVLPVHGGQMWTRKLDINFQTLSMGSEIVEGLELTGVCRVQRIGLLAALDWQRDSLNSRPLCSGVSKIYPQIP